MYERRLDNLRRLMEERKLDAYFTVHPANIYYLSGYRGDTGYLLVTLKEAYLYTYPLFMMEAEEQTTKEVNVRILKDSSYLKLIQDDLKDSHSMAIEKDYITHSIYKDLFCALSDKIRPISNLAGELRKNKDEKEIEFMKKAQEITDRIFRHVLNLNLSSMTELDLAAEMEYQMKKLGAEGYSFKTIVAAGENSAIPHARPRNVKIGSRTNLLMDFGVYYMGYASDMTRTIHIGNASEEFKKVYNIVLNAQKEAENAVKKGKKANEIDQIARKIIEDAGYGEQFTHGLGHGVGIEVHELPRVNRRSEEILEENMVITIEPGIYFKNKFGVRIEDMVIVKKDGFEIITQSPKELIEL